MRSVELVKTPREYRRAFTEAQRSKVTMECSSCGRDVEVFTYNPKMDAWLPRPATYPPRPTGLVWPSMDPAVRDLPKGTRVFRCHRRCGRCKLVTGVVIALCCEVAAASGDGGRKFLL